MCKKIFISLPVSDLAASQAFYSALGFSHDPQFSDSTAACMVWSEAIHVMLLTQEKWRSITNRPIPPHTASEVALNVLCPSREAVDAMNHIAATQGGTGDINPVQDLGFMYSRDFLDPDGHAWGAFWMANTALPTDTSAPSE